MKKAIIIEDNFIIGLYIRRQLEKSNVRVVATIDRGEDLAAMVREHHPDVLLIDVNLGGPMDGIDAASELPGDLKPALIFITGTSDKNICERILKLNPLGLLSKPIDMETFRNILSKIEK